ncbi:hypothetical protein C8F04DRAFT_1232802 [Mycena alexandri]|uniref:Uncharacterized protein n=1 Tax=Mycena alexandri TaxID=1745969 RepID=A0AAD6T1P5_9AGAR|nr:hypothetical protein C8F04DRAFT_1232802 [Mycena alexandri]
MIDGSDNSPPESGNSRSIIFEGAINTPPIAVVEVPFVQTPAAALRARTDVNATIGTRIPVARGKDIAWKIELLAAHLHPKRNGHVLQRKYAFVIANVARSLRTNGFRVSELTNNSRRPVTSGSSHVGGRGLGARRGGTNGNKSSFYPHAKRLGTRERPRRADQKYMYDSLPRPNDQEAQLHVCFCRSCGYNTREEVQKDVLQVLATGSGTRDGCGEGESVGRGIGRGELGKRGVEKKGETPRDRITVKGHAGDSKRIGGEAEENRPIHQQEHRESKKHTLVPRAAREVSKEHELPVLVADETLARRSRRTSTLIMNWMETGGRKDSEQDRGGWRKSVDAKEREGKTEMTTTYLRTRQPATAA